MWQIQPTKKFIKNLQKLDVLTRSRIENFLDKVKYTENPREIGKAMQGDLKGFWRYRVGDYRVIVKISHQHIIIYAIDVGHRKEIYK